MRLPCFGILMPPDIGSGAMTDRDYQLKLDELDRLLNDPDSAIEPSKVWSLLAEISHRDLAKANKNSSRPGG
jgi:hypothetical protein